MNLILIEPGEVDADGVAELDGPRSHHLFTVLKSQPGDNVRIGLVNGPTGLGRVLRAERARATLQCTWTSGIPERPAVDLLLALPRPKVMRRLWAHLAALGTGQIILTNAARVERNYFDTHVLSPDCYRPLILEGLQQARDTRLPPISIHRQFRRLIEDELDSLFPSGLRLVADPGASTPLSPAVVGRGERILLAIGPEGGWNAFEMQLLAARGFRPVGLGPRTLRSDTACIALLATVHAMRTMHASIAPVPAPGSPHV